MLDLGLVLALGTVVALVLLAVLLFQSELACRRAG